jgi:hypothetical protein
MAKYSVLLFCVLLTACRPGRVEELIGEDQPILDSFIVPYTGRSELSQAIAMSDSVLYSFDREAYAYTRYQRYGDKYQLKEQIILSNASESLLGFFMDSSRAPNFISVENTWFKLDTANKLYANDTIRPGLQYLGDRFRIFSTRHRPLLLINDRLYFSPIWRALEDYHAYLKEPCLVSISINRQNTEPHREYFTKPGFFNESPNPRIAYCFNGREIVMLYPNRDTLYCYNIATTQYTKKAIRNPFYSQPDL